MQVAVVWSRKNPDKQFSQSRDPSTGRKAQWYAPCAKGVEVGNAKPASWAVECSDCTWVSGYKKPHHGRRECGSAYGPDVRRASSVHNGTRSSTCSTCSATQCEGSAYSISKCCSPRASISTGSSAVYLWGHGWRNGRAVLPERRADCACCIQGASPAVWTFTWLWTTNRSISRSRSELGWFKSSLRREWHEWGPFLQLESDKEKLHQRGGTPNLDWDLSSWPTRSIEFSLICSFRELWPIQDPEKYKTLDPECIHVQRDRYANLKE